MQILYNSCRLRYSLGKSNDERGEGMQDKKEELVNGVKATVAQYGLSDFSIRLLGDMTGVNPGLIYHYFEGKDDLLVTAYCKESGSLFSAMQYFLNDVHDIPFAFDVKVRLWFHKTWQAMLSDAARLIFCTAYYHSSYFKDAAGFHKEQIKDLEEKLGEYFETKEGCERTMYSLQAMMYDSAMRVVNGDVNDTAETEEYAFSQFYGLLSSQIKQ